MVFGGFEVKMWKCCVLTPQKHYPARIRVCWCIACQNRFNGLSSRSVENFAYKERKKNCGNFGYMGRRNPWGDLDQMWHVGKYGERNHLCNIWWLPVKGCECSEMGKFAFSDWLEVSPLQHWSRYRMMFSKLRQNRLSVIRMICAQTLNFITNLNNMIVREHG